MGIRSTVMNFLGFGKAPARVFRRAYSGAMVSRLTSDWMSTQASADAEIRGNLAAGCGIVLARWCGTIRMHGKPSARHRST